MPKVKDLIKKEIKSPVYWEASLSNGSTARGVGEKESGWKQLMDFVKKNNLKIKSIRIVARSRFYHLPSKSKGYRFDSKPPEDIIYIYDEDYVGIKAIYKSSVLILWVGKKQGHCWVQYKDKK